VRAFPGGLAALAFILATSAAALDMAAPEPGFMLSFSAGGHDRSSRFLGGTEIRHLAAYEGKLYAGNGFWQDRPRIEGAQGAAILVLDAPAAQWRVDQTFDAMSIDRKKLDFAISALEGASFRTDASGAALPRPVSMLLASTWNRVGTARVWSRDDTTGQWSGAILAEDAPAPDAGPQITSLAAHRDRATGVDMVFAGHDPRGIFAGTYDPLSPSRIRWTAKPELDIAKFPTAGFPGLEGWLRVTSFAECNGALYAAVGQQIYERIDGAAPRWRLLYTNPSPFFSQTGLRGLTAIDGPAGTGQVLLAAIEGKSARIVRIDPKTGAEATDLDIAGFLDQAWSTQVGYVVAAYNDMAKLRDPAGGTALLIGLEVFIPKEAPVPPGHTVSDGREAGAWYLIRHADGRYAVHRIATNLLWSEHSLAATRAILGSPFANDEAVYFAGYDANGYAAHNTAWIFRAPRDQALR
jgi:hypothetical protein